MDIRIQLKIISMIFLLPFIIFYSCKGKDIQRPPEQAVLKEEIKKVEEDIASPSKSPENHKPRVTGIDISNPFPRLGDTLRVFVTAYDPDGDEITYIYEWSRSGEIISTEETLELSPDRFKRGDEINLRVVPYDGKDEGDPGFVTLTINNSPPEIISSPREGKVEKRVFTYHVRAFDPDGDHLTYFLKTSPGGMTIDPETGLIKWPVPPEFKGKASVTVSVTDGYGGEAVQSFEFTIQ